MVPLGFGQSFGLNFGVVNQDTYLIPALRLLEPSLLERDWFASFDGVPAGPLLRLGSRYLLGLMLARTESAELARRLLRETCEKHGIEPGELIVHSDRGAPMTSKTLGRLLDRVSLNS